MIYISSIPLSCSSNLFCIFDKIFSHRMHRLTVVRLKYLYFSYFNLLEPLIKPYPTQNKQNDLKSWTNDDIHFMYKEMFLLL